MPLGTPLTPCWDFAVLPSSRPCADSVLGQSNKVFSVTGAVKCRGQFNTVISVTGAVKGSTMAVQYSVKYYWGSKVEYWGSTIQGFRGTGAVKCSFGAVQ